MGQDKVTATANKCGTAAGYRRHRRAGETPCRACKRGHAATERDRRAKQRRETAPPAPATPVDTEVDALRPPGLRSRGRALWDTYTSRYEITHAGLVLLGEAARSADKLDRLAGAINGRRYEWARVDLQAAKDGDDDATELVLVVDGLLGAQNSAQTTLRGLVNSINKEITAERDLETADDGGDPLLAALTGSNVASLDDRRAAK